MKIRAPKDFWAGIMFTAFGVAFLCLAQQYQMGVRGRMGPAFFPSVLGAILALLGAAISVGSFLGDGPPVGRLRLRPNLCVLGSVVLWAMLLPHTGLVVSTCALIFASSFSGLGFRWKEVFLLSALLVAGSLGIFVYGLGLPVAVWPWQ